MADRVGLVARGNSIRSLGTRDSIELHWRCFQHCIYLLIDASQEKEHADPLEIAGRNRSDNGARSITITSFGLSTPWAALLLLRGFAEPVASTSTIAVAEQGHISPALGCAA